MDELGKKNKTTAVSASSKKTKIVFRLMKIYLVSAAGAAGSAAGTAGAAVSGVAVAGASVGAGLIVVGNGDLEKTPEPAGRVAIVKATQRPTKATAV